MGDKAANVRALHAAITAAADEDADVVVLPECSLVGWLDPNARSAAEPIDGPTVSALAQLAAARGVALVCGIEEARDGHTFNAAVLIDAQGTLLLTHRKVNELDVAAATYARGDSLAITSLHGIPVAVTICADSWIACITDVVHLMGARVVFSPSAWAADVGSEAANAAWIEQRYRERVGDRDLYLIGVNGVGPVTRGPWAGKVLHGDSLVMGPGGRVLASGRRGAPDLVIVDLPL